MHGFFLTATDTGAGKTWVAAAIVRALRQRGVPVRVCKPVATGAVWDGSSWQSEDARQLAEAAGQTDLHAVAPWVFSEPAAPPVAARACGATLTLDALAAAVRRCWQPGELLVVEGIGGLLCPLTDTETVADLVRALGLPLIIVARRSLGTLNHTLLTVEAALSRGLAIAGVVVSETAPVASWAEETNVAELRRRLAVPILAVASHGNPAAIGAVDWRRLAQRGAIGNGLTEEREAACKR